MSTVQLIKYSALSDIQTDLETLTVETDATTARTITASDSGKLIRFTSSSSVTVTLPTVATEDLEDGFGFLAVQEGAGSVIFATEGGDTLQSYLSADRTAGQYAQASVVKLSDDGTDCVWQLGGEIV